VETDVRTMSQSDFESLNPEMQPEMIIHPEPTPEVSPTSNKELGLDKPSPFNGDRKEVEILMPWTLTQCLPRKELP
jgi:hypothetical protein